MHKKTKNTLGIAAIVHDKDGPFLLEWLHFHKLAGVDQFFLTFNCTAGRWEQYGAMVKDLPFKKDIYINFNGNPDAAKTAMYRTLMECHKDKVEWVILADIDEFFFNPDKEDLKTVLKQYNKVDCGGIIVPWTQFGLSDYVGRPPLPITDHLVLQQQQQQQQQQYKVIAKTSEYRGISRDWYFDVNKPYIYQNGIAQRHHGSQITEGYIVGKIKCHHYFARQLTDITDRYKRYKGNEKYKCNLFEATKWCYEWTEPNEDATLYSKELRQALGVESHDATPKNTLFLSIADWSNSDKYTASFRTSAQLNDVPIIWVSEEAKWEGFIQNKVIKVLNFLKKNKKKTKYAFVLDAADVIFTQPLKTILDKFNRVYKGGVVFNSDYDGVMWPLADPLLQWNISTNYGRNGIVNAGCYCGLVTDIITLLEQLLDVRQQIIDKDYRQYCTRLFSASRSNGYENKVFDSKDKLINDDQWLFHIMQCEYTPLIVPDRFKQIFALTNAIHNEPRSVYARDCLGTAGILHISHIVQGLTESNKK